LLEDLSEGSLNGEKGVLTLPHSLSKYKEVNTNCNRTLLLLFEKWCSQTISNDWLPFFCRYTTRMVASASTLLLSEQPLLLVSIASDHVGYGTKRYDTIVARISLIEEWESKDASSSDRQNNKQEQRQ
jgi:hypothetical protein